MNLYYEYDLTKEKLETSINKSNIKFRKGVKEFLEKANKYKIPLIILSAGIGNVIKETLEINKCYFDNMYIISNFIEFDMNGNMSKFEGKMIHPLNKSIEGKLPEDIKEKISQKQYGLLVGDLIEDKEMVPEEQLENVITVGFLMNDNNLEVYNQNFDIVLNNEDATFENINDLVLR